jgi:hypothetical protein
MAEAEAVQAGAGLAIDLDKTKLDLSAETAPFWRPENIPGLLDFIRAVFPGVGREDMKALEQMVREVLVLIESETRLECPHHGSYWVTMLDYVLEGGRECPVCACAARLRAEQQMRGQ